MLRINLLPAYIAERRKTRLAIVLASLIFLVVTGGLLGYQFGVLQPQVAAEEQKATDEEAIKARVDALVAAAASERQKIQPIKDKVNFVEDVHFHNTIRSKVFRNAAKYTDPAVEYSGMAATGNTLNINAYAKNIADLGRFYITMFGNPDVTAVSFQGIHGWPKNQAQQTTFGGQNPFGTPAQSQASQWFPVQLVATLVKPIVTPQLPASLGATGQNGMNGMGMGPEMAGPGMAPPMSAPMPAPSGAPVDR